MEQKINLSTELSLGVRGHSNFDFVDIVINDDTKLFIDPCLFEIDNDPWIIEVRKTTESFFEIFYKLYRNNASRDEKLELLSHAHEINATKLGYGNGKNGKAKTAEGLYETFLEVEKILSRRLDINNAMDLAIFIRDYAEDCLSDMLTNILFKHLNDFTLKQCHKYNILTTRVSKPYYYWNITTSQWEVFNGECLEVRGELILLVPKKIIRNKYYYNTSQYITRMILEHMQEERQYIDAKGKIVKPTKKELKKSIFESGVKNLDFSIEYSIENPDLIVNYHRRIPEFYQNRTMTDEQLDKRLYRHMRNIPDAI